MHSAATRRATWLAAAIVFCVGLGLAGAAARAGEDPGQVTSVIGDARASDTPLDGHAAVGEREQVVTGEDGKCSMLVDGDIVIQLCERTRLVIRRDREQNYRIIQVDSGNAHVIAAPRLAEERIEIHTPAAIAILLGTIVHVAVDPDTGDSTISATHSRVRVRSTNESFEQETLLGAAQQITVRRGAPPPAQPQQLAASEIAKLTSCIADLREAALQQGRSDLTEDTVTRMAESDGSRIRTLGLEGGSRARPSSPPEDHPFGEDLNDLGEICSPLECGDYGQRRGGPALVAP